MSTKVNAIHLVDVEVFYRFSENFHLLVVLEKIQGITKIVIIHPLGTTNVCFSRAASMAKTPLGWGKRLCRGNRL